MPPATVLPGWLNDALQGLLAGDVAWPAEAVHSFYETIDIETDRLAGIKAREADDEIIIEADGHHQRIEQGVEVPFDVRYIWFITVRGGQVTHFTDYTLPGQPA